MELVLKTKEIKSVSKPRIIEKQTRPEGLLNSNYQKVVASNYNNITRDSIFGIKQYVKSRQYQEELSVEAVLKVSVFVITFLLVF